MKHDDRSALTRYGAFILRVMHSVQGEAKTKWWGMNARRVAWAMQKTNESHVIGPSRIHPQCIFHHHNYQRRSPRKEYCWGASSLKWIRRRAITALICVIDGSVNSARTCRRVAAPEMPGLCCGSVLNSLLCLQSSSTCLLRAPSEVKECTSALRRGPAHAVLFAAAWSAGLVRLHHVRVQLEQEGVREIGWCLAR